MKTNKKVLFSGMMKILIAFSVSIFIIFVADLPTGECDLYQHVVIAQPCTQGYEDNWHLNPCYCDGCSMACCWEIIGYRCDGSIYLGPNFNGACCVPRWHEGNSCENSRLWKEQHYAANYPSYSN